MNKATQVYRVETHDGKGPYVDGPGYVSLHNCDGQDETTPLPYHPAPYEDGLVDIPDAWQFGFASLRDFEQWFTPQARGILHEAGFSLSVYEAPRVRAGVYQVLFDRERARHVRRFSLA